MIFSHSYVTAELYNFEYNIACIATTNTKNISNILLIVSNFKTVNCQALRNITFFFYKNVMLFIMNNLLYL